MSAPASRDKILDSTEAVTPASQTSLPAELTHSSTPAILRLASMAPAKRRISQRAVLIGLAGLVIVVLASGIVWLTRPQTSLTRGTQVSQTPTSVTRHSPAGIFTEFAIPTSRSNPNGIAKGPDGNLWFTQGFTNEIGRITSGK